MTSHSPPGLGLAARGPRRGRLALGGAANTVLVIRGPEGAPLLPFRARGPAGRHGCSLTRAAWGLSAGPREHESYRAEREVCVGDSKTEVTFRVTVKKEG